MLFGIVSISKCYTGLSDGDVCTKFPTGCHVPPESSTCRPTLGLDSRPIGQQVTWFDVTSEQIMLLTRFVLLTYNLSFLAETSITKETPCMLLLQTYCQNTSPSSSWLDKSRHWSFVVSCNQPLNLGLSNTLNILLLQDYLENPKKKHGIDVNGHNQKTCVSTTSKGLHTLWIN